MKLISALLQESISGLFTNSTKDMEARDYQVFKKGYQMLGGEVYPEKDSEVGRTGCCRSGLISAMTAHA